MRLPLLAALFAAATAVAAPQPPADPPKTGDPKPKGEAVEVTSKEGRFTATFPGKTTRQAQEIPVGDKKSTITQEMLDLGDRAYLVVYNDYPKELLADTKPEKSLENVRDGNVGPGRLIADAAGTFGPDKLPMREFTFEKDKVFFRNRIVLDGNRLYQVMVVGKTEKELADPAAKKLFDSFAITRPKK